MPGKHNVSNFMLGYAIAKELGVTTEEMKKGLKNIELTGMRLELIKANGYTVLDDSYNSESRSSKNIFRYIHDN